MEPHNNATELFRSLASQSPFKGLTLASLISQYKKTEPIKTLDLDNDDEFRAKVGHVLKPGQHLLEFCAETGLGPIQARTMTAEDIARFCQQAEANAAGDECGPSSAWKPKQVPAHFVID